VAVALALLIAAALPTTALAQDSVKERSARQEFDRGARAAAEGDLEKALQHYKRSYQTLPHPRTLFNLAAVAERLNRKEEAFHAYRNFIATATSRDRDLVAQAEQRVDLLARDLRAKVKVDSSPPGATVFVDGNINPAGTTPLELSLTPGGHVFRLVAEAHETTQVEINIAPLIDQAPQPIALPEAKASLRIRSEPRAAMVTVDGIQIGNTPLLGDERLEHPLRAGPHQLNIAKSGYETVEKILEISGPESIEVDAVLRRPRSVVNKAVLGSVFAIGVATAAIGAGFGIAALAEDDHDLAIVNNYVMWPGLAVAGGAVLGWFLTRPEPSEIQTQRAQSSN